MKKNLAKFLLLSSMLGGMAIAQPVSANTKAAVYEYKNGQLDLVQKPTYEGFESNQLSLKLKTGRVDVVGAREGKKESAHDAGAYQFALIYKSEGGRLLPKTGQETGVVLATLGLLSLAGIAIVSLRKKF